MWVSGARSPQTFHRAAGPGPGSPDSGFKFLPVTGVKDTEALARRRRLSQLPMRVGD